jgi:hypothetical protein
MQVQNNRSTVVVGFEIVGFLALLGGQRCWTIHFSGSAWV